jgi:hypothetical protein
MPGYHNPVVNERCQAIKILGLGDSFHPCPGKTVTSVGFAGAYQSMGLDAGIQQSRLSTTAVAESGSFRRYPAQANCLRRI